MQSATTLFGCVFLIASMFATAVVAGEQERVRVADNGQGFVLAKSGTPFTPWGFNYDHDERGRLIEDYWVMEWTKVEEDFREMKTLGANVVRVHLQIGKFMRAADTPNEQSLDQLGRLLKLAESQGLYIDLTGLGCYHKADVPAWYDTLDEQERWRVQARFWAAVAKRSSASPAVFCYDLMNEPVVPGNGPKRTDWLGPAFAGKHFVQFIARQTNDRPRHEIASRWIRQLRAAIREHDARRPITVGLVPWSLDRPGLTSGFVPAKIAGELDFLAVHIYPESGKVGEALDTLEGFSVGKPIVIEELFPLKCSADELGEFIDKSRPHASGWIGFYWGKTPAEYARSKEISAAITLSWLKLFQAKSPAARQSTAPRD